MRAAAAGGKIAVFVAKLIGCGDTA